MTENVIVRPSYDPRGKMQIPNPYCTSAKHAQSYPKVSIVFSWTCICSLIDKLYRKKETSFFDLHLTPSGKMVIPKPYWTSTRHTQSYPRVHLSILWNVDRVLVTTTSPKRNFQDMPNHILKYNLATT